MATNESTKDFLQRRLAQLLGAEPDEELDTPTTAPSEQPSGGGSMLLPAIGLGASALKRAAASGLTTGGVLSSIGKGAKFLARKAGPLAYAALQTPQDIRQIIEAGGALKGMLDSKSAAKKSEQELAQMQMEQSTMSPELRAKESEARKAAFADRVSAGLYRQGTAGTEKAGPAVAQMGEEYAAAAEGVSAPPTVNQKPATQGIRVETPYGPITASTPEQAARIQAPYAEQTSAGRYLDRIETLRKNRAAAITQNPELGKKYRSIIDQPSVVSPEYTGKRNPDELSDWFKERQASFVPLTTRLGLMTGIAAKGMDRAIRQQDAEARQRAINEGLRGVAVPGMTSSQDRQAIISANIEAANRAAQQARKGAKDYSDINSTLAPASDDGVGKVNLPAPSGQGSYTNLLDDFKKIVDTLKEEEKVKKTTTQFSAQ